MLRIGLILGVSDAGVAFVSLALYVCGKVIDLISPHSARS